MDIGTLHVQAHWFWLIVAVILAVGEILIPGVFLIWVASAAAITGLITMVFVLPVAAQFALFALLALAATYAGRRWYVDNPVASSDPLLNDRVARLLGESVILVQPIINGQGRAKVGDGEWIVRGLDAPAGTWMRVTGVEGGTLLVEPRG